MYVLSDEVLLREAMQWHPHHVSSQPCRSQPGQSALS